MEQPIKSVRPTVQIPPKPAVPVMEYERPGARVWSMHDIAFMVVRILALWGLVGAIGLVGALLPRFVYYGEIDGRDVLLWASAVLIGVGIPVAAWIWSRQLARLILSPAHRLGEAAFTPRTGDLLAAAFAVLGAYLVTSRLPQLVYGIYSLIEHRLDWGYAAQAVVVMTMGIGLFLGSHGLARFWQRLRSPNPMRGPEPDRPKNGDPESGT